MVKRVKVSDLEEGYIAAISVSQLEEMGPSARTTIDRDIKRGILYAEKNPRTGRVTIPAASALAYLRGEPYRHDPQDKSAIQRMEVARAAKRKGVPA